MYIYTYQIYVCLYVCMYVYMTQNIQRIYKKPGSNSLSSKILMSSHGQICLISVPAKPEPNFPCQSQQPLHEVQPSQALAMKRASAGTKTCDVLGPDVCAQRFGYLSTLQVWKRSFVHTPKLQTIINHPNVWTFYWVYRRDIGMCHIILVAASASKVAIILIISPWYHP